MSVNSVARQSDTHFFGDAAYSLEADSPAPADPPVPQAPQVAGARYNPVAIAEPTDPPTLPHRVTRDERGNIEQANVEDDQVELVPVAGGAQVGFTKDPRPDDVRRGVRPEHQPVGDLREQVATKQEQAANQRAAARRTEEPKKPAKKAARTRAR